MACEKVVILPGNGGSPDDDIKECNWYAWVQTELINATGVNVILENMPDPYIGRQSVWIPFMKDTLQCDEKTVIIGHSTGTLAAMRYAEKNKVHGIVLVAPYTTDGGDENERLSGYFTQPWDWESIILNTQFRIAFGSSDDPLVPWHEIQEVMVKLQTDSHKFDNRGHFCNCTFKELVETVKGVLNR